MKMNTTTIAMTHVIRDRFACPQNADLRVTSGAELSLQGTGMSACGISGKGWLLLEGVITARTQENYVPTTFVITAVAFPAYGRPPV